MKDCLMLPKPCCRACSPTCWACGDESRIIKQRGHTVGAFCSPCGRELVYGQIPGPETMRRQSHSMGSKARLRYAQDQAARRGHA